MKKNVKKLVLDRETIRNLQDHQLTAAVGGAPVRTDSACPASNFGSCFNRGCTNGPTAEHCG